MNVIALATPYWLTAPTYNHTVPHNKTTEIDNSTTKGLWELCIEGDCEYFQSPEQCKYSSHKSFNCILRYDLIDTAGVLENKVLSMLHNLAD